MLNSNLGRLSVIGILEGISYLALLGVCMPLKYMYDMPEPTEYVGMAHGILFILYCALVVIVGKAEKWNIKTILWALVASLLPFGTFVADSKIFKPAMRGETTEGLA